MATTLFDLAYLNPLSALVQSDKLPSNSANDYLFGTNPAYNHKHMGDDFYYRLIRSYEDKLIYCQPYQQSDKIQIQWVSGDSTAANYTARILKSNGTVYTPKTVTVVYAGTIGGSYQYYVDVQLWDMPEGIYYLQLRHGTGTTFHNIIFEPFDVKQIHAGTVRLNYFNSFNDQSIVYYTSMPEMQYRVKGCLTEYLPDAEFNVYKDQPLNAEMVSGVPFIGHELTVGIQSQGVTDKVLDKINRITLCDTLKIDGKKMTRQSGAKLEPKRVSGLPLSQFTCKFWERENTDSLIVDNGVTVLGDIPQTNYFWVERITIQTVNTNIRQGFKGKRNFLDYLNNNIHPTYGYWYENANNKLVFKANTDFTISGTWTLDSDYVLAYGIKFVCYGIGDLDLTFYKGAIGTTVYYAIKYGDGTASVNRTAYTGSPNPIKTYSTNVEREHFIYFSNCEQIEDSGCTLQIRMIGGDLPPSFKDLRINLSATKLESIENNMFTYVAALSMTLIWLQNQKLGTYQLDEILRWLYDRRACLNSACEIYLDSQIPAVSISRTEGMGFVRAQVKALVTILEID